MDSVLPTGHFIDGQKGPIFVLRRGPRRNARGCVLVVPPFAEEMNKCRRMLTEVTTRLSSLGIGSVIPDLFGTGDSGGGFGDADWSIWLGDLDAVVDWTLAAGGDVDGVLAVRLGVALATDFVRARPTVSFRRSVFWQPVLDGARFSNQFLRLRVAASMMSGFPESVKSLRESLERGIPLEVAGYELGPELFMQLQMLQPGHRVSPAFGMVSWMETALEADAELLTPSRTLIEGTRAVGGRIDAMTFQGDPFWSSTEIVLNRELIDATVQAFAAPPEELVRATSVDA